MENQQGGTSKPPKASIGRFSFQLHRDGMLILFKDGQKNRREIWSDEQVAAFMEYLSTEASRICLNDIHARVEQKKNERQRMQAKIDAVMQRLAKQNQQQAEPPTEQKEEATVS